jgi:phage terminase Nu1 subunit (DNA packaging protein)
METPMPARKTPTKTPAEKGAKARQKTPSKRPSSQSAAHLNSPDPVTGKHDVGRFVSQARLGQVLGKNRDTIREWQTKGMPAVQRGDRDLRKTWLYDIAAVFEWREQQVAERVRRDLGQSTASDDSGDLTNKGTEQIKRAVAIANLALKQRYAVAIDAAVSISVRERRDVGNQVMSIPDLVARDLSGYPDELVRKFVREAKQSIGAILKTTASVADDALADLGQGRSNVEAVFEDEEVEDDQ